MTAENSVPTANPSRPAAAITRGSQSSCAVGTTPYHQQRPTSAMAAHARSARFVASAASGKISRGKYALVSKLDALTSDPDARSTVPEKNAHSHKPAKTKSG